MTRRLFGSAVHRWAAVALTLGLIAGCSAARTQPAPQVVLATAEGNIVLELYPDRAPMSTANFLRYVDEGRFAGASFYRVVTPGNQPQSPVKIEVIQGGLGFDDDLPGRLPPISHETTDATGVKHLDGTLSMARLGPGTASSEFFICVGEQPELDFGGRRNPDGQGFAAFGQVVAGMDVVHRIHRLEDTDQMLDTPVPIQSARRTEGARATR